MNPRTLFAWSMLLLLSPAAWSQYPAPAPRTPAPFAPPGAPRFSPPSPLLYVRFTGPAGMRVSFFRGLTEVPFDAPTAVGLRPGYLYRVKLAGGPDRPGLAFYPTIEVRGSLCLAPKMVGAHHPAPIQLTETDIRKVLSGSMVNKVIYLEDPDRAIPLATQADQPIELEYPAGTNLMEEARLRGRAMMIVRLGGRDISREEIGRQWIPGTVLLPNEKVIGPAACPPYIPWAGVPVWDPVLGPRPYKEECIPDGGDTAIKAGIGADGQLRGLDPTDTLAEYTDSQGRRKLAISNRVCICVPRYVVLTSECPIANQEGVIVLASARSIKTQVELLTRVPSLQAVQVEKLAALQGRQWPSGVFTLEGTVVIGRTQGLDTISSRATTQSVTSLCVEKPEAPAKLVLCKTAEPLCANVGDVVTFYLKYSNVGGQPIGDVAVSDSLNARLEYVPGSARSDRAAVFTTRGNEVGSVVLHWQLEGKLQPGQSGVVSFQAKIR